jgi:hypothetical protein
MKLLTRNACRLLAGGRELALINILTSSGAYVATITECEIPEWSGEFSVAGYTTFLPTPSLQGGKTRLIILVKNDLAVRAKVKVIKDIMDLAVQSVWLHFSHHRIGSSSSTLGAFILGGIYREWTPLQSREESRLRLGSLLDQISKAADGSRVVIHGDFNVDLDRVDDGMYYMATLAKSHAECTATAGLEMHTTSHTFRSYVNFTPHPAGDVASPAGGGPRPAGGLPSPAGGGQRARHEPAMSKVLETIVKGDLEEHLKRVNGLRGSQYGFRPKRSCTSALAHAQAGWLSGAAKGKVIGLMAFDLSAPFDTVAVDQPVPTLRALGIAGRELR